MGDNESFTSTWKTMKTLAFLLAVTCALLPESSAFAADQKPIKTVSKGAGAGHQCLDSFKLKLKDPDSGRVISFEENLLTYTATNDYGGRVQGRALCKQVEGKWVRDRETELEQAMQVAKQAATAGLACANAGRTDCGRSPASLSDSMKKLGFD